MYLIIYVIIRQTYRCTVIDRNAVYHINLYKVGESHDDSHFCGISINHLSFVLHVIYLFILFWSLSVTTLNGFLDYFNMNFPSGDQLSLES